MIEYLTFFERAKESSRQLINISDEQINRVLLDLATRVLEESAVLMDANTLDLNLIEQSDPMYERVILSEDKIKHIAESLTQVSQLESPLHRKVDQKMLSNGLYLEKVSVPLGVLGVIAEARPNLTFDLFALSLKSGNALLLQGGADAKNSNELAFKLIHEVLTDHHLPISAFQLLPSEQTATEALLHANAYVDVIIPRGPKALINFVKNNAKVPVIETGAGVVHVYVDKSADMEKAEAILLNSKTRMPHASNSMDCLIIHESHLNYLDHLVDQLLDEAVIIFADERSYDAMDPNSLIVRATEEHYETEFLSAKMVIKTVSSFEEALDHIAKYSSRHSEAIVAEDQQAIEKYVLEVDAAAVYVNASTAFTDGSQFGLGAEIGVSTQKLHARGPMGLKELCSYKWVVRGNGQVRKD